MPKKIIAQDVIEDPRYHDIWRLLKKYRDVVWSLEVSVQQMKSPFGIECGGSIEDLLEPVSLPGSRASPVFIYYTSSEIALEKCRIPA